MIEIRQATINDLLQLANLFNLYRIFYRKESDIEGAKKFLSERIQYEESMIYVAEENKKLIGFTQLYPQFSSTRIKRYWLLNDLYVSEEYRGRGISKLLIERAKQLSRDTKGAGLALETEKTNIVGNRLYPSVGFSISDKTNFYWWDNS
ncbi:MAG: GNAT family N-acetyltransferase [Bacteroidetes bacterium]|nr:GNAT family N-acetyltransferase [Bacteroidota bacterium]